MSEVDERYPERIRIDRTTDTGRFLGPFSADRTNGRSDMDSCIYVRADLHRGAVGDLRAVAEALDRAGAPRKVGTLSLSLVERVGLLGEGGR